VARNSPTDREKLDRELGELLQELRVLLPGVQVLFAFLLTVPFSARFRGLAGPEKALFLTALVSAALASAFLVAPGAYHRILFRRHDKAWMIDVTNRLTIIGTVFIAVAITCAVYLVANVVYGSAIGAATAGFAGGVIVLLWYGLPIARRLRR
jgi:hypothetical protein